jgi:outer membrane protein, heavy metal efflux system
MKIGFAVARARRACVSAGLILPLLAAAQPHDASTAAALSSIVPTALASAVASETGAEHTGRSEALGRLLAEAIQNNPEIRAARSEREAALQRVAPAGALDDPMLEAGILNLPATSPSFSREDMTMKMLGLSQRFPYPGKRGLKQDVALLDSESMGKAYAETVNRVVRDARVAYFALALVGASLRLVEDSRTLVRQLLKVADARYAVGQGKQVDVLRGQIQLSKLSEEMLRLEREQAQSAAELARVLGRDSALAAIDARLELPEIRLDLARLRAAAIAQRPQLAALKSMVARNRRAIELAKTEGYPDFDVRLSYGQRDRMPGGPGRSDMVSVTLAMNLPVWERTKTQPRVAEAAAVHEQALSVLEAQRNETLMRLSQQVAVAEQSLRTARLYRNEIIPQARLTIEAATAAYQVGRSDFALLLDSQMSVLNFTLAEAAAAAGYNKALAEIDLLTGRIPNDRPAAPRSEAQ